MGPEYPKPFSGRWTVVLALDDLQVLTAIENLFEAMGHLKSLP